MRRWQALVVLLVFIVTGCGTGVQSLAAPTTVPTSAHAHQLRVMSYSSFDISEEVIAAFETEHDVDVQFLDAGDTGKMVSQAILSKANPQADVLYGIDSTFLSRALEADIFEPYVAEELTSVPDEYELDPEHRVTPVDYGDVCLNYDRAYFAEHGLSVPTALADLTRPEYQGLLVVESPMSSSPGLAFLLATVGLFGETGYLDYWHGLNENDVLVVDSWDTAYYGEFTTGNRPIVVSYATSPAAEVYYSDPPVDVPPTGAVVSPGTCYRQIEFAGVLKNSANREMAEQFVSFVVSEAFQSDIPLHMWVFPVNEQAHLPDVFTQHAAVAEAPVTVEADRIEQNREAWISAWRDLILR